MLSNQQDKKWNNEGFYLISEEADIFLNKGNSHQNH